MAGWLKLHYEIVNDPKIRALSFADRWHFVALLCMRGDGVLDEPDDVRDTLISVTLGVDEAELEQLKIRLKKLCLIDENWFPTNWDKRQASKDATAAERMRKYRERKKKEESERNVTERLRIEEEVKKLRTKNNGDFPAEKSPRNICPYSDIVSAYHERFPNGPKVERLTQKRKDQMKARHQNELPTLDHWHEFFAYCHESEFLSGRVDPPAGRRRFVADLEWLTKLANYVKILEGKYHGG